MITMILIAALIVASWLYTWLHTRLPIHIFEIIRWAGWQKQNTNLWQLENDLSDWTRPDWEGWINTIFHLQHPPYTSLLAELLTCRNCLSWHMSFWTTILLVVTGVVPLHFFLILWWSTPIVSLYIVKQLEK